MLYTHMVVPIDQVRPHPSNARTHSKKQVGQIAASIRELGFAAPILIDENKVLIAGHGRLEAAKSLGMSSIPLDRHLRAERGQEAGAAAS